MSGRLETGEARATAAEVDGELRVMVGGSWQITAPRPSWSRLAGQRRPKRVRIQIDNLERWDTSLLLFLFEAQEWSRAAHAYFEADALPEKIRELLEQFVSARETSVPFDRSTSFLASAGHATIDTWN